MICGIRDFKIIMEIFEKMLSDIRKQSATYRQYFGNRMLYKMMLEKYKEYGLIER